METEKRFLVDVGMAGLPFPVSVISKKNPEGQQTIAKISISARIMKEFEAKWIDKFIKIAHSHMDKIGTKTLRTNILDYLNYLNASTVKIDFDYPFFAEKLTPVSNEKCLVSYQCTYSGKVSRIEKEPKTIFKISIPVLTTYPISDIKEKSSLFAQTSIVDVEIEPEKDIFPEEMISIVDKHALSPVYSFLTEEDQNFLIKKLHTEKKTSVVMLDEIKEELSLIKDISWYRLKCSNYGILHSYHTIISTEKSMWVPFSTQDE
ncbi:MAG: GTP cyclohydrolase, FolE2/MptA family [Actinomycetota bacterium]|jgi:GTP cyclohydrolase FolE2|nr:GTP cyclohydrolase, FolE2/MptA family [Actinomycetota bacterium]